MQAMYGPGLHDILSQGPERPNQSDRARGEQTKRKGAR